jgi:TolA-binding protein
LRLLTPGKTRRNGEQEMDLEKLRQELKGVYNGFENQIKLVMKNVNDEVLELANAVETLRVRCINDISRRNNNAEARIKDLQKDVSTVQADINVLQRLAARAIQDGIASEEKKLDDEIRELKSRENALSEKLSALKALPCVADEELLDELRQTYKKYCDAVSIKNCAYQAIWTLFENEWDYAISSLKSSAAYSQSGVINSIEELLQQDENRD